MDPEATLLLAFESIELLDPEAADDALDSYVNWRGLNGFEPSLASTVYGPIKGDEFFNFMIRRYESQFGEYEGARLEAPPEPPKDPRRELILRAVGVVGQTGRASGAQAAGPALAAILRAALADDPVTDPRKVVIGTMKNMRAAMASLRAELDAIDSIGY